MNERRPLSQLLIESEMDTEPIVPFAAMFGDDVKIVTAVLERTAVLSEPSDRYDRKSVRHDQVLVDPAVITWRLRTASYEGHRLLDRDIRPGSAAAIASKHMHRPGKKRGSYWRRQAPITPGNVPGEAARAASDERALTSQREVEVTKQRELAAHRQQSQKRHEEEAMSVTEVSAVAGQKTCRACGHSNALEEFGKDQKSKDGLSGKCKACMAEYSRQWLAKKKGGVVAPVGMQVVDGATNGAPVAVEKKARKPRVKKGRASGKKRHGKTVGLGAHVFNAIGGPGAQPTLNDGEARHTRVLALLRRQDALRTDLQRVTAELLEVVG